MGLFTNRRSGAARESATAGEAAASASGARSGPAAAPSTASVARRRLAVGQEAGGAGAPRPSPARAAEDPIPPNGAVRPAGEAAPDRFAPAASKPSGSAPTPTEAPAGARDDAASVDETAWPNGHGSAAAPARRRDEGAPASPTGMGRGGARPAAPPRAAGARPPAPRTEEGGRRAAGTSRRTAPERGRLLRAVRGRAPLLAAATGFAVALLALAFTAGGAVGGLVLGAVSAGLTAVGLDALKRRSEIHDIATHLVTLTARLDRLAERVASFSDTRFDLVDEPRAPLARGPDDAARGGSPAEPSTAAAAGAGPGAPNAGEAGDAAALPGAGARAAAVPLWPPEEAQAIRSDIASLGTLVRELAVAVSNHDDALTGLLDPAAREAGPRGAAAAPGPAPSVPPLVSAVAAAARAGRLGRDLPGAQDDAQSDARSDTPPDARPDADPASASDRAARIVTPARAEGPPSAEPASARPSSSASTAAARPASTPASRGGAPLDNPAAGALPRPSPDRPASPGTVAALAALADAVRGRASSASPPAALTPAPLPSAGRDAAPAPFAPDVSAPVDPGLGAALRPSTAAAPAGAPPAPPDAASAPRAALPADAPLELFLQPVVTLPHRRLAFYEASPRLRTASGEAVSPLQFVADVRAGDLGPVLDKVLVGRAARTLARLAERGRPGSFLCRLSDRTALDPRAVRGLAELIRGAPGEASGLVIGVGQGAWRACTAENFAAFAALEACGASFLVDAVADLRMDATALAERGVAWVRAPAALLLAPVSAQGGGPADVAARDVGALLARAGIGLVAGGVETQDTLLDLLDIDVPHAQGSAISPPRPMRADALEGGPTRALPAADAPAPSGGRNSLAAALNAQPLPGAAGARAGADIAIRAAAQRAAQSAGARAPLAEPALDRPAEPGPAAPEGANDLGAPLDGPAAGGGTPFRAFLRRASR